MRVDEFDYELPRSQIAQQPPAERGRSRLLVLDRARRAWVHGDFPDLVQHLRTGDVLVRNDTRVIPARVRGKRPGGGAVEILLLSREEDDAGGETWTCLARPGRRLRRGESANLRGGMVATWLDDGSEDGLRRVRLRAGRPILEMLDEVGEVPLPPYIERPVESSDRDAYQTVYAARPGAVAAPTAGLHFTRELLSALEAKGVEVVSLTLHVGPATFLPVRTEDVDHHRMGGERVEISAATVSAIEMAKREGRRVVAVGTTTVRALEGTADRFGRGDVQGEVSLFIVPGHRFHVVDCLITNFHLPRSTLLMLVSAFAGRDLVLGAYRDAVARGYRFYSYGDAMLIV